jgi:hypothetical protein
MKAIYPLVAAAVLTLATQAPGDPPIIDSFSQYTINLSNSGGFRQFDFFTPSLINFRDVQGFDNGSNDFWSVILDPSIGILRYNVSTPLVGFHSLSVRYRNTVSPFNITLGDYTAFYFAIPEVTGTGELFAGVNVNGGTYGTTQSITQPGEIFVNFSAITGVDLQQPVTGLQFVFRPTSSNFSVGVDHIALLPEPGGALLLLSGAGILAMRRRRA